MSKIPESGFSITVPCAATTATASSTASAATQAAIGRVRNPLPAEHPAYTTIGRVASEWAHLEHALDIIIWEIAGLRFDIGSCITGQMTGHWPRFKAIMALGAMCGLNEDLLKDIDKTAGSATELAQERNRIVHDAWYTEALGTLATQFRSVLPKKKNKQPIFGLEDVTKTFVSDLITKIVRKREHVFELRVRIKSALATSQRKQPS